MGIAFTKMSGSGNDFIIIDNRVPVVDDAGKRDFVRKVCTLKLSVGADGVIFVEDSDQADFRWDFYNSDGSSADGITVEIATRQENDDDECDDGEEEYDIVDSFGSGLNEIKSAVHCFLENGGSIDMLSAYDHEDED